MLFSLSVLLKVLYKKFVFFQASSVQMNNGAGYIVWVPVYSWISLFPVSRSVSILKHLFLKAPVTTAADDIHKKFFIVFQRK